MQIAAFANALHARRCCPPCVQLPGITLLSSTVSLSRSNENGFSDAENFGAVYGQLTQQSTGVVDWPNALVFGQGGGIAPADWESGAEDATVFASEESVFLLNGKSKGLDPGFAATVAIARPPTTIPGTIMWAYAYDYGTAPEHCVPVCEYKIGAALPQSFLLGKAIVVVSFDIASRTATTWRAIAGTPHPRTGIRSMRATFTLAADVFTHGCQGDRRIYGLDPASTGLNIVAPGAKDQGTGQPLLNDGVLRVSAARPLIDIP